MKKVLDIISVFGLVGLMGFAGYWIFTLVTMVPLIIWLSFFKTVGYVAIGIFAFWSLIRGSTVIEQWYKSRKLEKVPTTDR